MPCSVLQCRTVHYSARSCNIQVVAPQTPPSKSLQKSQYQYQSIRGTGEALSYSTIYPTPPTPSSLTWVPQSRLAFGHHCRVSWPSGLWPLAITILQCATSLTPGGYNRPCWLIKSFYHGPDVSRAMVITPPFQHVND